MTVSGATVRTETSGGGRAALAAVGRRHAAAALIRRIATATTAAHVTRLLKRFISVPVGEGDDYRAAVRSGAGAGDRFLRCSVNHSVAACPASSAPRPV